MCFRRARWFGLAAVLLCASGCRKASVRASHPPEVSAEAASSEDPVASAARPVGAETALDGGVRKRVGITPELLERYVRYRKGLDAALSRLPSASLPDGGFPLARRERAMRRFLRAKEAARVRAGITPEAIREIFAVSTAVLAEPSADGVDGILAGLKKVRERLPAAQRVAIDARISQLQRERDEAVHQSTARKRFGDAAVDLVLAHASELEAVIARRHPAQGAKRGIPRMKAASDAGTDRSSEH